MKIYLVGGAVRDRLLGRAGHDRDFVVVGAAPEDLAARGFVPVGAGFPVFIDKSTGDEYALARTEKKRGRGYKGFVFRADPSVTLEEDLARRDFTVNAMAQDGGGKIIDPFGGRRDLKKGILRHVSPAFGEDPLRVLRAARFLAQWPRFSLAKETAALLKKMSAGGELQDLTAERVWRELARGLESPAPQRMIAALKNCGALPVILPEVDALGKAGIARITARLQRNGLRRAKNIGAARFAAMILDIGAQKNGREMLRRLCRRLRAPVEWQRLAASAAHPDLCRDAPAAFYKNIGEKQAAAALATLSRLRAWQDETLLNETLAVWQAAAEAAAGRALKPYAPAVFLRAARRAALKVDAAAIAANCGGNIARAVRAAREQAVTAALKNKVKAKAKSGAVKVSKKTKTAAKGKTKKL